MIFYIHKTIGGYTNTEAWKRYMDSLKEDQTYKITVESAAKRSLPQNSYYWRVVVPMVFEGLRNAGFENVINNEDAHEIMKTTFLKEQIPNEHGLFVEKIRSTASLTKPEFNLYLERIWQWAAEFLGVYIPNPNEDLKLQFND